MFQGCFHDFPKLYHKAEQCQKVTKYMKHQHVPQYGGLEGQNTTTFHKTVFLCSERCCALCFDLQGHGKYFPQTLEPIVLSRDEAMMRLSWLLTVWSERAEQRKSSTSLTTTGSTISHCRDTHTQGGSEGRRTSNLLCAFRVHLICQ